MKMEGAPQKAIEVRALEALGQGFDLSSDFRLKFAKGLKGGDGRLVVLNEASKRDIVIPNAGGVVIRGVPQDISCDKGDRIRFKSDVLELNQMSELLNQKSSVQGKIPSGYLNAIFDLTGDWLQDAAETKSLAFDGFFISLYYLQLTASPLILHNKVQKSVPSRWDPAALSRFIRSYGTHIIIGMAVGGQDLVCVKQKYSSPVPTADVRRRLEDLGDFLFSGGSPSLLRGKTRDGRHKVPDVFDPILQTNTMQLTTFPETSSKDGLTMIFSKRGGDVFSNGHSNWLQSVLTEPEAILFKFVPITSLLTGIPGSGYLSHAINLYLRYKPAPEDLQHFLEFQVPRQWAPMFCEMPLSLQRKKATCPTLQLSLMGPKIYVNSTQVSTSQKPVVGLRLYLEGKRRNRLALHVQHLSSLPNTMDLSVGSTSTRPSWWRGSDDSELSNQFLEPINWKRYSKICSSVVKHDPNWLKGDSDGVYIVTGAQLLSKGKWPKTVLHLRLHFSHVPNCGIRKTEWAAVPEASHKSSFLTNLSTTFTFTQRTVTDQQKQDPAALNSGVYPDGPPMLNHSSKLLKYVETAEVVRGPHDAPGHWLVTAAKLVKEGGKIGLHVKFALLDYW
ncbi:MACPF domain-containing protein At1g14780-like [Malus sylvestris]|uniref:MACPF domain-containing protein At1g14780-like n=1 Tax=Malus sylvestris TaxID=3752 RepID=UPI0021AC1FB5|nr:MACPF domain-containing protein At1g14780-like [Malus sylvestris]XP_050143058.1 MACPF domain-containing protein At1g14780-like [Malus sylvestris]